MVKVKICGITNLEDALHASRCGADTLGFIFTPKSPRYIQIAAARKIIAGLDPLVTTCGVFMDQPQEEVIQIARALHLDILQFHGEESASYCRAFQPEFKVIKVLFAADRPFDRAISRYDVDAYIFDIKFEDKAAGPQLLPPEVRKELADLSAAGEKVIISSGLNPDNIAAAIALLPYGVDVASGVEEMVGKKDHRLVEEFIRQAKCSNE